MIRQIEFTLRPRGRGFHLVTDELLHNLQQLPKVGLLNLFLTTSMHTPELFIKQPFNFLVTFHNHNF